MTQGQAPGHEPSGDQGAGQGGERGGSPPSVDHPEYRKGIIVMPMDAAPTVDIENMAPTGLPPAPSEEPPAPPPPQTEQ